MDPIERGKQTEERGFRALKVIKEKNPEFDLHIRRTSPEVDVRGIDCFVRINLPEGLSRTRMTIPIEFKSSWFGVEKWKVVHRDLYDAGVLVFRIPKNERKARRLLYRGLESVRHNSRDGTLYHSMFQRLFKGGSRNLWRNIALIRKRRAEEAKHKNQRATR
jgi:hypothetical protein